MLNLMNSGEGNVGSNFLGEGPRNGAIAKNVS